MRINVEKLAVISSSGAGEGHDDPQPLVEIPERNSDRGGDAGSMGSVTNAQRRRLLGWRAAAPAAPSARCFARTFRPTNRIPFCARRSMVFSVELDVPRGNPEPAFDGDAVPQMRPDVALRRGQLPDDRRDLVLLRRVRLDRDDLPARPMTKQVVPAILLLVSHPHALSRSRLSSKEVRMGGIEVVAMRVRNGAEPVTDGLLQRGIVTQAASQDRSLSLPTGHASSSFTAVLTASPKRDEYSVSPPQPETPSSSEEGSRAEISFEWTFPASSNSSR